MFFCITHSKFSISLVDLKKKYIYINQLFKFSADLKDKIILNSMKFFSSFLKFHKIGEKDFKIFSKVFFKNQYLKKKKKQTIIKSQIFTVYNTIKAIFFNKKKKKNCFFFQFEMFFRCHLKTYLSF